MISRTTLLNFDDITIIPSAVTKINSRSEIADINNHLWVAPMDTIIDNCNLNYFLSRGLNVPLVRGMWKNLNVSTMTHLPVISLTLDEVKSHVEDDLPRLDDLIKEFWSHPSNDQKPVRILVDVANGHMKSLHIAAESLKTKYQKRGINTDIYIGNIANPQPRLIESLSQFIKGVRVGIGGGSRCHTSSKTAIHYPMASLIADFRTVRDNIYRPYKIDIIADGGIRDTSDIIKAFALGADAVMLGKLFNQTIESAGNKYVKFNSSLSVNDRILNITGIEMDEQSKNAYIMDGLEVDYRGMSTIDVQLKEKNQTSNYEEGFSKRNDVLYTLDQFLFETNKAVKSAFSYCDAKTVEEFFSNSELHMVNSVQHNKISR